MSYLVFIIFLFLLIGLSILSLVLIYKYEDLEGLVYARTRSLKKAEKTIEHMNDLLAYQQDKLNRLNECNLNLENKALYEEIKILREENSEATDLINNINNLANGNKYNSEKIILDKIKELVSDYQSYNQF